MRATGRTPSEGRKGATRLYSDSYVHGRLRNSQKLPAGSGTPPATHCYVRSALSSSILGRVSRSRLRILYFPAPARPPGAAAGRHPCDARTSRLRPALCSLHLDLSTTIQPIGSTLDATLSARHFHDRSHRNPNAVPYPARDTSTSDLALTPPRRGRRRCGP